MSDGAPIRNHRTDEGTELGSIIAKWCDDAEPKARLRMPALPPRCNSCACRQGYHLANSSRYTQMDFLKCVLEGREFYCHEPARKDQLCSGWAMFMLTADKPNFVEVAWPFLTAELPFVGDGTHPQHAALSPEPNSEEAAIS